MYQPEQAAENLVWEIRHIKTGSEYQGLWDIWSMLVLLFRGLSAENRDRVETLAAE